MSGEHDRSAGRRRRLWAAVLAVALGAGAAYARTATYQLVWDDPLLLEYVETIYRGRGLPGVLAADFRVEPAEKLGYYRPVALLSLWTDARLAARIPWNHHVTNIALHAAVSALVLLLALLATGSLRAAVLGGAVFAVHPVHVESVAFVSGRTDLLAALFTLLAAAAWVKGRRDGERGSPLVAWGGVAAFALATLCKEAAYALPPVLLAWDAAVPPWRPDERPGWWARNRFSICGWAAVFALGVALRWGAAGIPFGYLAPSLPAAAAADSWGQLRLLPGVIATYLRLLSIPWPLNAFYTPAEVRWGPATLAGAALALAVFAAAGRRLPARAGLLPLAWAAGFLLPVLKLVPITTGAVLAERFLYLPSVGFCLAVGVALDGLLGSGRARAALHAATGALLAALAAGTVAREAVWRDPVALFTDLMRTSPTYLDSYYNLGTHYHRSGRNREAVELFEHAVSREPRYERVYLNLGNAYLELGEPERAVAAYRALLRLSPGNFMAHYDLGNALAAAGRPAEAIASYAEALRLRPDHADSLNNLGRAALAVGDYARAREAFVRLGTLEQMALFHLSRGTILARQGRTRDARRDLEILVGLGSPRAAELAKALGPP